jgi:hypothetical protein
MKRFVKKVATLLKPAAGRRRRTRLFVEELEPRVTPTVVFHPYFGSEPTIPGSGPKLNNTPVELIFWGSSYWNDVAGNEPNRASASSIANSIDSLLSSPAYQHLSQYGAGASPYLADWWIDFHRAGPGSIFTDTDLRNEIVNTLNDPLAGIRGPGDFSATPLYIVITPFGTVYDSPLKIAGYHSDAIELTKGGIYDLVYGWVGQPHNFGGSVGGSNLDTITSVFSHESSEAMTDAQPFSGIVCIQVALLGPPVVGEIGDFEPEAYNAYDYRVSGVLVQAMWDYNAQAFTVSDGNSQHMDLYPNYTHNADGSYTYSGSTLDVYGDQFGAGSNDSITLDTSSGGGVQVTLNSDLFRFEPGLGITQINVLPGTGTNTVQVNNTTSNCPVSITGNGLDNVTIGNSHNGVQGISAGVNVTNPPNYTTLNINDAADPYGRTAYITSGRVTGLAPGTISFNQDDIHALNIYGGSGGNTFYVQGTPYNSAGVYTYLSSGSGGGSTFNNVNVEGTSGALTVDGGRSRQAVYIGSKGYNFGGTLAGINGSVFVENSNTSGITFLYVDDSGDATGQTTNLYFDEVTSTGMPSYITWNTHGPSQGGVTSLQVRGGSGFNTFNVFATGSGLFSYATDIETRTGGANVNVQSTLGTLNVNDNGGADNVTIGSLAPTFGGTLANINGSVYVQGSSTSSIALYVDDSGDPTGRTVSMYDGQISGLAPATIHWSDAPAGSLYGGVNSLEVLGGSGYNTFGVYGTGKFYYSTWLQTGTGGAAVNVQSTSGYLYVDNNAGLDVVTLGSTAPTLGGTLANINGTVNVYGNGSTYLYVDERGDSISHTATLTSTSLTGLSPAPISWTASAASSGGVTFLSILGSAAGSTYNLSSTPTLYYYTDLSTGAGNDAVNVQATGSGLYVHNNGGHDSVIVGSKAPATSGGTLANINGFVDVYGAGTISLILTDGGDSTARTATLTSSELSGLSPAPIYYSANVTSLTVDGGSGNDTFNVQSTAAGMAVTVNAGPGSDTVNVGNADNKLDDIRGALRINGQAGTDTVNVLDQGQTAGQAYRLTATALARPGKPTIAYATIEQLVVSAGSGNDSLTLATPVPTVATTFDGGGGTNRLTGANVANTWTINAGNSGSVGTVTFTSFQDLVGGSGDDTFKFLAGGSIAGTINGGAGSNTLDYSGNGGAAVTVSLLDDSAADINGGAAGGFSSIESLVGSSAASDQLIGSNANTTWTISSADGGSASGFAFSGIENLVGGSGVDIFRFTGSGSISGSVDGGGAPVQQGNWLDYSALSTAVTVNLQTNSATGVGGGAGGMIANIQDVLGSNGGCTLTGNSQGNILVGGTGNDTIQGGSGASLLIGGKGADWITGSSGGDILIGDSTTFDANISALASILAEWQSSNSYSTRVSDLKNGGGLNGSNTLIFGTTVLDDQSADTVTAAASASALDWFFQGVGDTILNKETGEQVN